MTNRSITITALISLLSVASMASARTYSSAKGLVEGVRSDEAAMARYESHFGMNRDQVLSYLGDLHRGTLAKAGTYSVCENGLGGSETQITLSLPKGEAVFMDDTNTPILMAENGYPMSEASSVTTAAPAAAAPAALPATATTMTSAPMTMLAAEGGKPNYTWLSALPVIIPIVGMTNSDSSGGNQNVSPVPEPASLVMLGLGAAGLIRRRNKKA